VSVVANVAINVDSRGAVGKLRDVQNQAQATERAFGALQQAVAAFGAGFALSKVIADVKELDTNLRRLSTVGGDVAALDKGLGALSKQLDGIANKAELAAASYQALSAGFTETSANLKVVEAATKAAVGGLVDVAGVVEVTTKTLNAYGMSGNQAIKVTDSISKAIEYGQVQWSDYTSQLGRVASIAAVAGVSLDEVNAFVAAATKNGATAEVAFTGLGATLATILKPSKESAEAAKALGINWTLAGIRGEGFESLMVKLAKAMQENPVLATEMVGGQEAIRGAFAAASKGGKDYQMILEGLGGATGKTDADFKAMKDSLENELKALDTAFKNLSEALGKAFGPTVVNIIGDVTGAVNGFASAINAIPQPVATAVAEIVKIVAQMILLQKAMQAIIALRAGYIAAMASMATSTTATGAAAATSSSAFALYARNTQTLAAQSAAAAATVTPLGNALRSIASIGIITVGINLIVSGLANAIKANQEIAKLRGQRAAGGAAAMYGGAAPAEAKAAAQQTLNAIKAERKRGTPLATTVFGSLAGLVGQQTPADLLDRMNLLRERELTAQATLGLSTRAVVSTGGGGGGATGGGMDGGKKKKGKTDAERAAEQAARIQAEVQGLQRQAELAKQLAFLDQQTAKAEAAKDQQLVIRLQGEEKLLQLRYQFADELAKAETQSQRDAALAKATAEAERIRVGTTIELGKEQEKAAEKQKEQVEKYQEALQSVQDQIALAGALNDDQRLQIELQQRIRNLEKERVLVGQEQVKAYTDASNKLDEIKKKSDRIKADQAMQESLVQGVANELVGGISAGIDAVTSSTKNLNESLQEIGQSILSAVGKMLIFYALAQAFGALSGGNSKSFFGLLAQGFGYKYAEGGYVPGGFQAFANGGMVDRPTLGLVGEGGESEYIIPASKMRSAMSRYAAGARGSAVIPAGDDTSSGGGTATMAPAAIDVRYTVERINSVDYVTADQFRAGMAQAAQQGATQGEQRTLRRLQQSRATRSRLGMN
jgi:TP901 family phage tail tape measure protein